MIYIISSHIRSYHNNYELRINIYISPAVCTLVFIFFYFIITAHMIFVQSILII